MGFSLPSIRFYSRAHFSADYIRFVKTLDGVVVFQISSRPDAFTTRGCSFPGKSLSTPLYSAYPLFEESSSPSFIAAKPTRALKHGQISYFVSLSYIKRRIITLIWWIIWNGEVILRDIGTPWFPTCEYKCGLKWQWCVEGRDKCRQNLDRHLPD